MFTRLNSNPNHACRPSTQSQSNVDNSHDDFETSTEWKFEGHLDFAAGQWTAGETYEDKNWAAVKEQYIPNVHVPVQHMAFFYNLAAAKMCSV